MKKLFSISILALTLFICSGTAYAAAGDPCTLNSDCSADAPNCNFTTFKCQAAATSGTTSAAPDTTGVNNTNNNTSTGFVPLVPIPGLTDNASSASSSVLATFLNNLYKYLIGIAAILAVIQIIRGGLEYATQDSVSKKDDGKHHIQQAILGLVLILSPVLIFSLINPSILHLGIDLPILNTAPGNWSSSGNGGGSQAQATDSATGCTVSGTYLQKASCSSSQAAQNWASSNCTTNPKALKGGVLPCQTQNSAGCTDTTFQAYCELSSGPYIFIDTAQSGFSFSGIVNAIVGYAHYEPVAKSNSDPNNGADVLNFASACSADGGSVCVSDSVLSTTCSYTSSQSTSQSNSCYSKTLMCEQASTVGSVTNCSSNPRFTVIQ